MLFVADLLHRAVLEERDVEAFGLHALQQAPEDALEGLREGPRPLEGLEKDHEILIVMKGKGSVLWQILRVM